MYLSKLELHGFKSFADRTVLHFDPGITSVVGPNGCGKSNVVDAVRWVIGEQRARILRSEKMENVIFNGTDKRRRLGLAEVLLTIENTRGVLPTEYSEVTLGRRLYRSGESEYLLNGVSCRLKDVVDLFMDTGMGAGAYSVIELKMIDEILSDNAHDRRHLFEEAAGITKYKLRRGQALRKLDSTQADLTRLRDLTEEIGKRVRSLKRQAKKAARFKKHEERLRRLELALAQVEYNRLRRQEETLGAEQRTLKDNVEGFSAQLAHEEARLEERRTELVEREQTLATRQRALNAHQEQTRDLEAEKRLEQERLDTARRDRTRTLQEQDEAEARGADLEATAARLEEELSAAGPHLAEAERLLQEAQAARDRTRAAAETERRGLHDLRQREQQAEDDRAARRRALDRLTARLDFSSQEQTRLQAQLDAQAATGSDLDERLAAIAAELETAWGEMEQARIALEAAQAEHEAHQQAHDAARETLQQAQRRREAAAAEVHLLDSLVASYEEFSGAVQFLAANDGWSADRLVTVADVLACDDADRLALDAALGELAACIVVANEAEARQAVALLRARDEGQATFIVLDRLPPAASFATNGHAAPPLLDAVRVADDGYRALAALLLRHSYLVDTLDDVLPLDAEAGDPSRYFARTGEWVDARGLVHGGSRRNGVSPAAGRIGRREQLDAARQTLADLETEVARLDAEVSAQQQALDAVPLDARRTDLGEAERTLGEIEKRHARLAYEQEAHAHRTDELSDRLAALQDEAGTGAEEIASLETAVAEAEETLATLRRARAEAEEKFQDAEAESRAAFGRFSEANVAAVEARNRRDNLQRDLDRTRQALEDLQERAEARQERLRELEAIIEKAQQRLEALATHLDEAGKAREGLEQDASRARTALMETKVAISDVETRLRRLRNEREQHMKEENLRAVRLAEVKTRTHDLLAHLEEDFGIALVDEEIELPEDFEEATARQDVQALRSKLKSMGAVNALALESYEEEKERLAFLEAQQQDLEQAETTLLRTIGEINTTAAARFDETFQAIRTNFSRLFADLFGEDAAADLELVDPDDPLESPIEIKARPRGKRPSTISQLSGGEKALTAIALLFAIYLVKPSPFCILDEVDAPLDDANIGRFMQLIRSFADQTQFIVVTHNKRTMEAADRLYGITMQEQGVSKLVGVKFDEAMEMAN